MRLVTVTPAGRRRYVEILANYLLRRRDVISEHQWWLNTSDELDAEYLRRLTARHPEFFRIVSKPLGPEERIGYTIWQYMKDCTDADTVYLRLDDDICYVGDAAIVRMYERRLADPDPFLILGNIVNNSVCTHFHQRAGLVPASWGRVNCDCMDDRGWRSGPFARKLHRLFLRDLEEAREARWTETEFPFSGVDRFSINAICWRGEDFAAIGGLLSADVDEEPFLTSELPRRLGRPNVVCREALFSHFAFGVHRTAVEKSAPDILLRYRRLALPSTDDSLRRLPWGERAAMTLQSTAALAAWQVRMGISSARTALRSRAPWLRDRDAA